MAAVRKPWTPIVMAIANDLRGALSSAGVSGSQQSRSKWGGSVVFTSAATNPAITPPQARSETLVSLMEGAARTWVVTTRGAVQASDPITAVYPFTVFRVRWSLGGQQFQTFIDGHSDQYLTVYAESVQVFAEWDFEVIATAANFAIPMFLPQAILLTASICPSAGTPSLAKRTLPISLTAGTQNMQIPFGARDALMRALLNADASVTWQFNIGAVLALGLESYSAAQVLAAHDIGNYLPVPSQAEVLQIFDVGAPLGYSAVEFRIQP